MLAPLVTKNATRVSSSDKTIRPPGIVEGPIGTVYGVREQKGQSTNRLAVNDLSSNCQNACLLNVVRWSMKRIILSQGFIEGLAPNREHVC